MSHNPLYPGFPWSQAFDFPAGFLQPGDALRADFRRYPKDASLLGSVRSGDGIEVDVDRVFLSLSAEQSRDIGGYGDECVVTNFVVIRGSDQIPIGVLITIPVVILPTRPE